MVSSRQRCSVCGRAVERVGHAKVYVHADQFHQRLHHAAVVEPGTIRVLAALPGRARVIDLREDQRVTA